MRLNMKYLLLFTGTMVKNSTGEKYCHVRQAVIWARVLTKQPQQPSNTEK